MIDAGFAKRQVASLVKVSYKISQTHLIAEAQSLNLNLYA